MAINVWAVFEFEELDDKDLDEILWEIRENRQDD